MKKQVATLKLALRKYEQVECKDVIKQVKRQKKNVMNYLQGLKPKQSVSPCQVVAFMRSNGFEKAIDDDAYACLLMLVVEGDAVITASGRFKGN